MESLNEESLGGYDAYFINQLSDEHECPVCRMALRKPIQTLCGHRLCLSCAKEMRKRNKGVLICPSDNSILDSSKIFPDAAIERVIMQLKVKCNNFSYGCEWTGELKILNIHEENCECLPLCCVNQCGMKLMRKEMSSHITDSCANTIIPCQYLNIGCKFKGMRKEHETHANSSMQNHLSMSISLVEALENKITLTVDTLENNIASKVSALENKIMSKVESLETKIVSIAVALKNKITLKAESFENKNASKVVALENKITSTVDALKNELISKVDAQKDKIMLHEKNLEIIKAFLAVKTQRFIPFLHLYETPAWIPHPCNNPEWCFDTLKNGTLEEWDDHSVDRNDFLNDVMDSVKDYTVPALHHIHFGSVLTFHKEMQKKFIYS
ncbi:TNF receptor-associated factor 6-A-like isoform X2 [Hydra vulgaris]|uniref:TNF receptor-associated factor 6-A-like isoform X2 n=1 Tax=Hydra vulgaris TaxID=6087 RepID=A0ABM4CE53_HYDVU